LQFVYYLDTFTSWISNKQHWSQDFTTTTKKCNRQSPKTTGCLDEKRSRVL